MRIFDAFRLDGKVAIVSGAHAWLGYDMACALAEAGSHVIVTSRDAAQAAATSERIRAEYGVDTLALRLDQRHHEQVRSMAEEAQAWKGKVDILINNAGGGSGSSEGHLHRRSPADEQDLIATNLTGVLFCCKEVSRFMVQQGHGKIINIASIAGMVGRDRRMYERSAMRGQPIDYAAAKAGVIGMTRDLAALLSPHGIHVNCISPGGFDKGDLPQRFIEDYQDRTALGRWGKMGVDIKGAALFFSSAASDYITGQNLAVDGGFSIWQ